MKLVDLLATLKSNNILVTVKDLDDNEIAKIYASSYNALDDDVVSRRVSRWYIRGASAVEVTLDETIISA